MGIRIVHLYICDHTGCRSCSPLAPRLMPHPPGGGSSG